MRYPSPNTEYVSASRLARWRETDFPREHTREEQRAAFDARRAEIAEYGFLTPVTLHCNLESGRGYVEDNDHSVSAAHQLGVPVPVVVEESRLGKHDPRMRHQITAPRPDWEASQPSTSLRTMTPSQIGLPVISPSVATRSYDQAREGRQAKADQGYEF